MAEGRRPGGLTALAVLNFVFGGFGAIFGLLALAGLGLVNTAAEAMDGAMDEAMSEMGVSMGMLLMKTIFDCITAALLIVSGVGYIKLKRVLGRTVGSLYGIVSLAGVAIMLVGGFPFGFGIIIALIYPVLTLSLVNLTFKDDLVY
jgi:hypothetical protein